MRTRKDVRGALIGMVLGDGHMRRHVLRDGKTETGNNYLEIAHGAKQRDYLQWKMEIVQSLFSYPLELKFRMIHNKKTGKDYPSYRFVTRTHPRFNAAAVKDISIYALENITLEGLAIWWCDNGCYREYTRKDRNTPERVADWALHRYPLASVERLAAAIEAEFGVRFNVNTHSTQGGPYLRLGGKKSWPFLNEIRPYAPECMWHKFPKGV